MPHPKSQEIWTDFGDTNPVRVVILEFINDPNRIIVTLARLRQPGGWFKMSLGAFTARYAPCCKATPTSTAQKQKTDLKYKVQKLNQYDPRNS